MVGREELKNGIWGEDVWIEESALAYQINQLRKVLGDRASNPQYVKTYPKRGFRFIATVKESGKNSLSETESASLNVSATQKALGVGSNATLIASDNSVRNRETTEQPLLSSGIATGTPSTSECESARLGRFLGGHLWHVLGACSLYAALFAVELLIEIAYQFDQYGNRALIITLPIFCWIFVTAVAGFVADWKWTSKGSRYGFAISLWIFLIATAIAFRGVCLFLPSFPITESQLQAHTAQGAYLKTISYFLILALFFLITTFHFTVSMQRDFQAGIHIKGELFVADKIGMPAVVSIYWRLWALTFMLILMFVVTLFLHDRLINNLVVTPYTNLFTILVYIRAIIYFALGIQCLIWYYQRLGHFIQEWLAAEGL